MDSKQRSEQTDCWIWYIKKKKKKTIVSQVQFVGHLHHPLRVCIALETSGVLDGVGAARLAFCDTSSSGDWCWVGCGSEAGTSKWTCLGRTGRMSIWYRRKVLPQLWRLDDGRSMLVSRLHNRWFPLVRAFVSDHDRLAWRNRRGGIARARSS